MTLDKDSLILQLEETVTKLRADNAQLKMGLENASLQLRGPAAPVLDCVGYLTIKHFANGGLQVSGNIGDLKYALGLLDHARDSINANSKSVGPQLVAANGQPLVAVPNRDVDLEQSPKYPTKPFGEMNPEERGDLPP